VAGSGASHRWQAADFEQFEPERLDLREHAVQRGAIRERSGQHGIAAAPLSLQGRERGAYRLAQAAADTDAVPVRGRITARPGHVLTTHAAGPGVRRPAPARLPLLFIDQASLAQSLRTFLSVRRVSRHRIIDVIEPAARQLRANRAGATRSSRTIWRAVLTGTLTQCRARLRPDIVQVAAQPPLAPRCWARPPGRTQITSMMRCHLTPPDASLVQAGQRHRKKIASRRWALPGTHLRDTSR